MEKTVARYVPVNWSIEAERLLSAALGSQGLTIQEVKQSVIEGRADLMAVYRENLLGFMVIFAQGDEMVFQLGAGYDGLKGCFPAAVEAGKAWAKKQGFKTIRAHCEGPARVKLHEKFGFCYAETVLRIEV